MLKSKTAKGRRLYHEEERVEVVDVRANKEWRSRLISSITACPVLHCNAHCAWLRFGLVVPSYIAASASIFCHEM